MIEKFKFPPYFTVCSIILILLAALCYLLAYSTLITDYCQTDKMITNCAEKINVLYSKDIPNRQDKIRDILGSSLTAFERRFPARNLFGHLSMAFAVAFILMITVEHYMRRKAYEEMGEDVLKAVLRKQVPEVIYKEVIDNILNSNVIIKNLRYEFRFPKKRYKDLSEDMIVFERTTSYEIQNLMNRAIEHEMFSSLYLYPPLKVNGGKTILPRYKELRVNGNEIEIKASNEEGAVVIKHPIPLKKLGKANVSIVSEENGWSSDTAIWSSNRIAENLYIHIHNEIPELIEIKDVDLIHPSRKDFSNPRKDYWEFTGGLLPGQGFKISWELVKPRNNDQN